MIMNRTRITATAVAVVGTLALAGCASTQHSATSSNTGAKAGTPMAVGMTMPDRSIMGAGATSSPSAASATPSASARMVCTTEVRSDVTKVAALTTTPMTTSTFVDHLYTCTYALPMGSLIVSVKDLANLAATTTYFADVRPRLGTTATLAGLAEGAFGTPNGTVVLRKDSHVLEVDASHLPAVFGSQSEKRADFAYEIASDILGCWTNG
jgi:hypothetical protein